MVKLFSVRLTAFALLDRLGHKLKLVDRGSERLERDPVAPEMGHHHASVDDGAVRHLVVDQNIQTDPPHAFDEAQHRCAVKNEHRGGAAAFKRDAVGHRGPLGVGCGRLADGRWRCTDFDTGRTWLMDESSAPLVIGRP